MASATCPRPQREAYKEVSIMNIVISSNAHGYYTHLDRHRRGALAAVQPGGSFLSKILQIELQDNFSKV